MTMTERVERDWKTLAPLVLIKIAFSLPLDKTIARKTLIPPFFFFGKNSIRVEEKVAWTGKDEKISLYRLSHRTVQRYAHR